MRRRDFIKGIAGSAVAWPLSVHAQQSPKIPRIGVLWHAGNEEEEAIYLGALRQGFTEIGFVEGKNFVLENRFAGEQYERFNSLATELAAAKVDVLIAVTLPAARAAQQATTTIPVVFVVVSDPVGFKLVDSLARPGRNMTGLSNVSVDLSGKRLELFKEALPGLSQVALLSNPTYALTPRLLTGYRAAAGSLGLPVQELQVSTPDDIEPALASVAKPSGLVLIPDAMIFNERKRIAELALAHGLPSLCWVDDMADAGLLMSYGPSISAQFRRVAAYVDKILRGAKPADLPVEQPTKFELAVNLKTAKALGLTMPRSLLLSADEVIE